MTPDISRRTVLKGSALGLGLAATGRAARATDFVNLALPGSVRDPRKPRTPVDHVVVLMMENRSTDHYLGWLAREREDFDATQTRTYFDDDGQAANTADWGRAGRADYTGLGHSLANSHAAGMLQLADHDGGGLPGEPDGWLKQGASGGPADPGDEYALAFYEPGDIPVTAYLARRFTTFDRYFASVLSATLPNRMYMHSARCGGMDSQVPQRDAGVNPAWAAGYDWLTIWDLLDHAGVTWQYYYSNLSFIQLFRQHALSGRHISHYYDDAAAGRLPQVAFVEPFLLGTAGVSNDDHNSSDIRLGQQFIADVVGAFVESPNWAQGALFLTYDEWGGFWDHVPPPVVDDPRSADGFGQLGFRGPTILVSPYARATTDHGLYDHTSVLRFIETNYGLPRLSDSNPWARDGHDRNIGAAFGRFKHFDPEVDLDALAYAAPPEAGVAHPPLSGAPVNDLAVYVDNGWFGEGGSPYRLEDSYRTRP